MNWKAAPTQRGRGSLKSLVRQAQCPAKKKKHTHHSIGAYRTDIQDSKKPQWQQALTYGWDSESYFRTGESLVLVQWKAGSKLFSLHLLQHGVSQISFESLRTSKFVCHVTQCVREP